MIIVFNQIAIIITIIITMIIIIAINNIIIVIWKSVFPNDTKAMVKSVC